jgi:hypothetical protein
MDLAVVQGNSCVLEDGNKRKKRGRHRIIRPDLMRTASLRHASFLLSLAIAACPTILHKNFQVYLANTRKIYPG